jgi:hypothetical protein
VLTGSVLIAAGLYQWSPLKNACLRYCQSPLLFISRYGGFRPDAQGSLVLEDRDRGDPQQVHDAAYEQQCHQRPAAADADGAVTNPSCWPRK